MRVNPKYSNVCGVRISMFRNDQCWDCKFLSECDLHYDEESGTFDYPILWHTNEGVKKPQTGKHFKRTNKERGQHRRIDETEERDS